MRNIMNIKKILVFGIIIITGLFVFNFYISFSYGSFNGFLAQFRSLPNERKLEQLRSDAIKQLTHDHAEFSSITGLVLHETTYSDMCAKGEHGWKREDSYAYRCSYRSTYYYGTNREYKELLLDVEKTANDLGWTLSYTPQPTISEAISQHSGEIFLIELPVYAKKVSGSSPILLTINGFYGYGVHWTKLSNEPDPFGVIVIQEIYHKNESDKSPEEIFNKIISSGQEAIMFVMFKDYFIN